MASMSESNDFPELDYFMNESKSDVSFLISGQRVPALKQVLALKSSVFEAMFFGNFSESMAKEVVIEDTTYEAFKAMVRFIYTEQLAPNVYNDYIQAFQVYQLSRRYQLNRLAKCVANRLKSMLRLSNIEEIYELAVTYNDIDLITASNRLIRNNFYEFITKDMNALKRMNRLSNNRLLETMTKMMRKLSANTSDMRLKVFRQMPAKSVKNKTTVETIGSGFDQQMDSESIKRIFSEVSEDWVSYKAL